MYWIFATRNKSNLNKLIIMFLKLLAPQINCQIMKNVSTFSKIKKQEVNHKGAQWKKFLGLSQENASRDWTCLTNITELGELKEVAIECHIELLSERINQISTEALVYGYSE